MEGNLTADFSIHIPDTIPVQVIATDRQGTDHLIGDFSGGVVLNGMTLQDVKTHTIIAAFSMPQRQWVIRGTSYPLLFMQVKPVD